MIKVSCVCLCVLLYLLSMIRSMEEDVWVEGSIRKQHYFMSLDAMLYGPQDSNNVTEITTRSSQIPEEAVLGEGEVGEG